jgi:hypothetical protein
MDVAAVFILSLLGGYSFASLWRFTRFTTRRADGHHLYFRAALYGVLLFLIALVARLVLRLKYPAYVDFESMLERYIAPAMKDPANLRQLELVITAGYSLIIGPILAFVLTPIPFKSVALRYSLGTLDRMLLKAQNEKMPVLITLSSGKVYIGLIRRITEPDHPPPVVVMVPMMSGHRGDDGRVKITTEYESMYDKVRAGAAADFKLPGDWSEQFELVIRADTIVTATPFSTVVFSAFNPQWKDKIAQQDQAPNPQEIIVEIKRRSRSADGPAGVSKSEDKPAGPAAPALPQDNTNQKVSDK